MSNYKNGGYNSKYQDRDFSQHRNGNSQNYSRDTSSDFPPIENPLAVFCYDEAKILLPGGYADQLAKKFKFIPAHQLRKILAQSKLAVLEIETSSQRLLQARRLLYSLLPMAAYNAGRDKTLRPLYEFLKAAISKESVKTEADIKAFDELITSIIAYHKFYAKS